MQRAPSWEVITGGHQMIGPYAEAVGGGAGWAMPAFPLQKPTTERLFRVNLSP